MNIPLYDLLLHLKNVICDKIMHTFKSTSHVGQMVTLRCVNQKSITYRCKTDRILKDNHIFQFRTQHSIIIKSVHVLPSINQKKSHRRPLIIYVLRQNINVIINDTLVGYLQIL